MKHFAKTGIFMMLPFLAACSSQVKGNNAAVQNYYPNGITNVGTPTGEMAMDDACENNEDYLKIEEIDFQTPTDAPTSSFSLDSSGSSWSNIRNAVNNGYRPSPDQVIIEQMINYFDYQDYESPTEEPIAIYSEEKACPWNEKAVLTSVAVKSRKIDYQATAGNNYVLLIDVSGSMSSSNKLPYVKKSFSLLAEGLNDDDILSIVTYSGKEAIVLDGAKGSEKGRIRKALYDLNANGCTNGESGIRMAYDLAKKHFIQDGNNQILLATDGDFNVGATDNGSLEQMVSAQKEAGIFFSCFGYGMGNYKDDKMQTLALNGNGNVYYIDSESEIERTFGGDLSSVLQVVSKDSKIQITFDDTKVSRYRLIGYENRMMTNEDFQNEDKDAGEIYSGRCVIALYEIETLGDDKDALINIDFRYKDPVTNESHEILKTGADYTKTSTASYDFATIVAEAGLVMRDSKYKGTAALESVLARYDAEKETFDQDYLKKEFRDIIEKYRALQA